MQKSASGKRIFWLGFGLLIIIGVLLWNTAQKTSEPTVFINPERQKNPLLEDVDSDGLQAWEEELYGTNQEMFDTDGDGVSDGEEVRRGRSPTTPQGEEDTQPQESVSDVNEEQNLTQTLIDELIRDGGAVSILQGDDTTPSRVLTQKLDELIKKGAVSAVPTIFSPIDTATSEDTTPEAVKKYLNAVADIFIKHLSSLRGDDLDLFLEILQSGNIERLSELASYRAAAERSAKDIRALVPPKNIAWFHSREIQFLEETARQLRVLENAEDDPVAALAVIPKRVDLKIEIIKFHAGELALWLDTNNIAITARDKAFSLIN